MNEEQAESQKGRSTARKERHDHTERAIHLACMWCPCTERWEVKQAFLCGKDAAAYCDDKMRRAARSNKSIEYWHVKRYHLCCGDVTWGCRCAEQLDDLGAPDCV